MKDKFNAFSQRYVTALRKHLKEGPRASLQPARGLGRQAVALGLELLDLARIHKGVLATLEASSARDGMIEQSARFFAEAITPIEMTHRAALRARTRLSQLNKRLVRCTAELAASKRSLKQGVTRRKMAEEALKKSGKASTKLLGESRRLQKQLQRLTHQILSSQENKRRKMSRDLQDEIAQSLLGINVRLLTLKKAARVHNKGVQKGIARTQRMVGTSAKSVKRFARTIRKSDET